MKRSIDGLVIAITGGARGIGEATARALSAAGARVAIGDLDLDAAEKVAADLREGVALRLDVSDRVGYTAFLDAVEERLGPLDVLVNNAGIMPVAALEDESDETTARQLAINLHAVIHGTREAARRMRPRGRGHIVNVASLAGKVGTPGVATYCATKHGVVGLSESVHLELRGTGVEVSCVMPAIVRTELTAGVGEMRGIKSVGPEDVAAAIVAAVRKPRLDVFVPKSAGTTAYLGRLLPRRGGEWIARRLGGDTVIIAAARRPERAAYEARAAASAPSVDQGSG
jgi:NAD(P)-dependent dehydrogenase (short-subunit alcohol dehydrogenase family)